MQKLWTYGLLFALVACAPANAHDTENPIGKIQVSGSGYASQVPDQATVSAGVVTQGSTANEAMSANAALMTRVFKALKAAGIKDKNIATSQMSLQPRYNYNQQRNSGEAPKITGYEVRNTVMAKSDDLDAVGPMLDALVKAGVNNINTVSFSLQNKDAAEAKARAGAVRDAKAKAQTIADAAGIRLGKVLEISESGSYRPPMPMQMARASADALESTPIAAGEQQVSVSINIVYAIDD